MRISCCKGLISTPCSGNRITFKVQLGIFSLNLEILFPKLPVQNGLYSKRLFKQNEFFFRVNFFFNKNNFFERGYKYLFWINNFFWKRKIFTEKIFFYLKIIRIFFLSFVQMKDEMVLSCLKLKQNSFKPLKQSVFTFTTKTF